MIPSNWALVKPVIKICICHLLRAVLRDEKKMAVNSSLSLNRGFIFPFDNNSSSIMNSSQKLLSSDSSMTMLNFEIKPAFECAMHAAR